MLLFAVVVVPKIFTFFYFVFLGAENGNKREKNCVEKNCILFVNECDIDFLLYKIVELVEVTLETVKWLVFIKY